MADYDTTLNQENTGSFFIPKLWEKEMIFTNPPAFVFDAVAMNASRANAYQVQWEVVGTLATVGTNVGEGTVTGTSAMTISTVTLDPQTYGNAVTWTNTVADWSVVDLKNNVFMRNLQEDYRRAMDEEAQTALLADTDAYTLVGGTWNARGTLQLGSVGTFDDNGAITVANLSNAETWMKENNEMPFEDGAYIAFLHPKQVYTLRQDSTWENVKDYADPQALLTGEAGKILGVRVIETTQIRKTQRKTGKGTGTSYGALVVAKDTLGKGFDRPLWLTFYDDDKNDGGRFKKMQWNARGGYKKLRAAGAIRLETTVESAIV